MFKVGNGKIINKLTIRSLKANRTRNIMAVLAIALTTILFSGLFSVIASVNESYQQQTFRLVGGYYHGSVKNVTMEDVDNLKKDPLIEKYGLRLFLGMADQGTLKKTHTEISYMDANCADDYYCVPDYGKLPQEGTKELATDTKVLDMLGIEPKVGAEVQMAYTMKNGEVYTDTFTLSGWWEYDEIAQADMVVVPMSYCSDILKDYVPGEDDDTGNYRMEILFHNSRDLDGKMEKILRNHGYWDEKNETNLLQCGINWAYTSTQFIQRMSPELLISMGIILLLIAVTGYLIIYNIFRLSVMRDIRYYGLLKTVGTTGKMIQKLIHRQAFVLSAAGIPVGLLIGFLIGNKLVPVIMVIMEYDFTTVCVHPFIFIWATIFAFLTVWVSCRRPGKIAAKVSPVEAIKYTDATESKKVKKKGMHGGKITHLAWSNLGRSKSKTALVVASLALVVVLVNILVTFTSGLDMEKFKRHSFSTDFVVGGQEYFHRANLLFNEDDVVGDSIIQAVNEEGDITEAGKIYGYYGMAQGWIPERKLIDFPYNPFGPGADKEKGFEESCTKKDGKYLYNIQLYGMDEFPFTLLPVIKGDITKLNDPSGNYIASVVDVDDYGNVKKGGMPYEPGETITINYGDREKIYTVCATVEVPFGMSYRYSGDLEFVLGSETFLQDTGSNSVMTYIFNTTDETQKSMGKFLMDYTKNVEPTYDYESAEKSIELFQKLRNMFYVVGISVALIVGLIGILNYINAIITGIHARRIEFATMEAVGMTRQQLKKMLVYEGMMYTLLSLVLAFLLMCLFSPLLNGAMEKFLWFYTGKVTFIPILIFIPIYIAIGILVPLFFYHKGTKDSIVERLRNVEQG